MSRPGDAIDAARKLQEMENAPEIIFFDLPGTMDNDGVLKTVASMDYIFCPAIADRVVMQSSLAFAKAINDHMITTGKTNIKGLYFVWNMVDGREKTGLYDIYDKVMAELGLSALKTFVPDSKRFRLSQTASDSAGRVRRRKTVRYSVRRCSRRIRRLSEGATSGNWQKRCWESLTVNGNGQEYRSRG